MCLLVFNFMIHVLMALYDCMMCDYYSYFTAIKERVGRLPNGFLNRLARFFVCIVSHRDFPPRQVL
jgi:hypothetical protein